MKKLTVFLFSALLFVACGSNSDKKDTINKQEPVSFAIVIHGGAGGIKREYYTEEQQEAYKEKLQEALQAGYKILENGGISLDAIQAAIKVMENTPLFNAGKGSV